MQIDADVAKHCRPWPLGGWVHKLARMHKTIHTEVRSSWHGIVSIHRLARVHKTPYTPKAVECRTRRKARQAVKETIHVWLQDRQPFGRHRTVAQWLPNGSVSKRADCWEVHTGQVNLFNTVAIGLPNSCVMNAGLWTWKSQSTCQLIPAVQSFVKHQLSQVVSLWDMLFNRETYCLMLSHTSHKFTAKKPMTRLQALSCSVKAVSEIDCLTCRQAVQLRDILSDLETCLTQDHCQDACYKIAYKLSHISSRQWARMSNLRQAVQLQDILSDPETCLTQDYCQDACDKIACKLSHWFLRMSMSRLSDFETGLRQCGRTSQDLALGLSLCE